VELTWTAEGGSDETTVTTGNSGGSSGTAWDTVNIGTDATLVYDTAQASHGSLSMRHATGATSTTANAIWDTAIGTPVARLYGRIYIRSADMTNNRSILRIRTGTTQIVRLQINASGELELRNSANTAVDTSTTVLSDNTWYRIEFDVRPGNPVTNTVNLYVGDSTSLTEALSASSNYSSGTTIDEFGVGNFAAGANAPSTWFDSIQINDSGLPGPATVDATATPAVVVVVAALPAAGKSAGSTPTPAAVSAVAGSPAASVSAAAATTPAVTAAVAAMPAVTVGGASITTLFDDFADNTINTTKWPANYGTVAETGGRARVDCDTGQWSAYKSGSIYTLTGSQVSARIYPPSGDPGDGAYCSLLVTSATAGTDAGFLVDAGAGVIGVYLRVGFSDAGALFPTYNATDHAYLRLREDSGTLYWESSPDGQAWTQLRSESSPSWVSDSDLALILEAHRTSGTDNFGEYDDVNVLSATTAPSVTAAAVGVPAAAVSAAVAVALSATAAVVLLPQSAADTQTTVGPAAIVATVGLPQATADTAGNAAVTPAAIEATVGMAQPSLPATVTPAAAAAAAAVPAAGMSADSTTTPAVVAAAVSVGQAAPSAGSAPTPDPVAALTALPAAGVQAAATVTPATVQVAVSAPLALPVGTGSAAVAPAVVAVTVALPSSARLAAAAVVADPVLAATALPAAALLQGATATPATTAAAFAFPPVRIRGPIPAASGPTVTAARTSTAAVAGRPSAAAVAAVRASTATVTGRRVSSVSAVGSATSTPTVG
jgi:hypothetical protein